MKVGDLVKLNPSVFTIPDTDEFHRIDVQDKDEEESALQWMYEQCGEDFDEFEWT